MGQQMQQGVLGGVKDPRVLNNKYLATLPSRILEIGDIFVLPDATLVLCGNTAPGWNEIHQIIQITTVGTFAEVEWMYYNWNVLHGRRFVGLRLDLREDRGDRCEYLAPADTSRRTSRGRRHCPEPRQA